MINAIIQFSLERRAVIILGTVLFLAAGGFAFYKLNIEAYPDPAPPLVEIVTQNSGQSAEEIERYITIPIEVAMAGLPGLQHVRSVSLYGLSDIKFQFSYESDYNYSLQQVQNRLNTLPPLPNGAQPQISPQSAVGEIYRYRLAAPPGFSLAELRTLQDWVLQRRFRTIPGVIDVTGWGGLTKEYHIDVDLEKLTAFKITLPQVIQAISNNNLNVGARTLDLGQQSANVRGVGLIKSLSDIENIVLAQTNGAPVLLKNVAKTEIGNAPRLGIAGRDSDNDIVECIVLMRRGEKTMDTLGRIEAEVANINSSKILPDGVRIEPYYNRRELIGVTTHTVLHNLVFGVLLLFAIQFLFLGNLRSAVIVAATIPFALFFAVLIMYLRGDSANLLSLGAIDFGIIVDATVIIVENIYRHLAEEHDAPGHTPVLGSNSKLSKILAAASEVSSSIFFSTAIIIAAFLPLFTMQGVEGQIFGPMAKTYGYALMGALMATFTVAPALAAFLLPEKVSEKLPLVMRILTPAYTFMLKLALRFRVVTMICAAGAIAAMAIILPRLGTEFLPKLDEGNLWIRATLPATISLEAGKPKVTQIREILKSFPEVVTVVSQHGRPDDGTDPAGSFNAEFFVPLKPYDEWPKRTSELTAEQKAKLSPKEREAEEAKEALPPKERLTEDIKAKLAEAFVGIDFNFSQNIEDNVEEAVSGVKGENSVKLFGTDLQTLEDKAQEIKAQLSEVHGVEEVGVFTELGQPNVIIEVNREKCARYGLATGDVNAIVQAAIGGQNTTDVYEQERHFPVIVRLMPKYREDLEKIRNIPVVASNGAQLRLRDVCEVTLKSGASYIYRENNERYIPIKFSVRGRDLGSTVAEAQARVAKVTMPTGYHCEWSGEFGELNEAVDRLKFIVPVGILLIVVLLYSTFNSVIDSMLVMASIPLTFVGGVLALYFTKTTFSVSAAVGFISLLGVAVMAGIILISHYICCVEKGFNANSRLSKPVRSGCARF